MTNRLGYAFVVHHTSGQLVNKLWQRLPLGLAHIEHSDCPKTYALHQWMVVAVEPSGAVSSTSSRLR